MCRWCWIAAALAACGGGEKELLGGLTGSWSGSFVTDVGTFAASAEFEYDAKEKLLTGEVALQEVPTPHTYAVRRWDTVSGEIFLNLTDVIDGTRGLDLEGTVDGAFSGTTTLRYPGATCAGTCGWQGTFDLQSVAGGSGPVPTDPGGGTGAR